MSPQSNLTPDQIAAIEAIRLAFFAENGKAEPKAWVPKFSVGDRVTLKGESDPMLVNFIDHQLRLYSIGHGPLPVSEDQLEPAPVDPLAEVKAAHERGEVVQWRWDMPHLSTEHGWHDCVINGPMWMRHKQYRVKPWTLPVPPEGREWHRVDGWRKEWLTDGWRPLLRGERAETVDEYYTQDTQKWERITTEQCHLVGDFFYLHRTKRPLPDPQRERFVSHFKPIFGGPWDWDTRGHYVDHTIQRMWLAWQAALSERS